MFICEICGSTHSADNSDLCSVCSLNTKVAKKKVTEKHKDSKLKLADLLAKAKRLVASQQYAINKHAKDLDVSESLAVVKMGNELFATKSTKAKLLALITANSSASKKINSQL